MHHHPGRVILSLIFTAIMLAAGLIPLLAHYGVIGWNITFLLTPLGKFFTYVLAGGALFIVIDSFGEGLSTAGGKFTIFAGLLLLIIGIFPIVGPTIPVINSILSPLVYYFLFAFEGLVLLISTFMVQT
jgi:hypothetical protein